MSRRATIPTQRPGETAADFERRKKSIEYSRLMRERHKAAADESRRAVCQVWKRVNSSTDGAEGSVFGEPPLVAGYCSAARLIVDALRVGPQPDGRFAVGNLQLTVAECIATLHNDQWIAYWYLCAPDHVKERVRQLLPELFCTTPPMYPAWAKSRR
jgi:hypothetical protein